jgi:hypothetical protein
MKLLSVPGRGEEDAIEYTYEDGSIFRISYTKDGRIFKKIMIGDDLDKFMDHLKNSTLYMPDRKNIFQQIKRNIALKQILDA